MQTAWYLGYLSRAPCSGAAGPPGGGLPFSGGHYPSSYSLLRVNISSLISPTFSSTVSPLCPSYLSAMYLLITTALLVVPLFSLFVPGKDMLLLPLLDFFAIYLMMVWHIPSISHLLPSSLGGPPYKIWQTGPPDFSSLLPLMYLS